MTDSESPAPFAKPLVVLVHGLAAFRLMMAVLARRLRQRGYTTLEWGYCSLVGSLDVHARKLRRELERQVDRESLVHVIGHSMGAILVRLALSYGHLPKVGRVVLISPPNRGTPVATFFGPVLQPVCPAIAQLAARTESFVHRIPPLLDLQVGVIAASCDWLVPFASTMLEGQADHIQLRGTHASLLFQRDTAEQIHRFLRSGRFALPAANAVNA